MKIRFIIKTFFLIVCVSGLFSINHGVYAAQDTSGWWINLEGGYAFSIEPNDVNVKAMPSASLPDNYVSTDFNDQGVAGIGFGYQFDLSRTFLSRINKNNSYQWFPANRIGLFYDFYIPATLSGQVNKWQDVAVYDYTYQVYSNTLWLNNQLDIIQYENIVPFIEVGIGNAWNNASDYKEYPLSSVPAQDIRVPKAGFTDNTQTAFAYRIGAGVNIAFSSKATVGLLYRYSDLGQVSTGASANYPAMDTGVSSKLRSNQVFITLRYAIGA